MKKALSIVLTLAMVLALAVPVFAATLSGAGGAQTGTSEILTKDTKADGTDGASFEVTYPASTQFDWNALVGAANVDYSAKTHLNYGETLTVSVSSEKNKMTLADNDAYALEYTLKDDAEGTAALADLVLGAVATGAKTVYVDIPQEQWDAAPVGTYSDILTFTAVVA